MCIGRWRWVRRVGCMSNQWGHLRPENNFQKACVEFVESERSYVDSLGEMSMMYYWPLMSCFGVVTMFCMKCLVIYFSSPRDKNMYVHRYNIYTINTHAHTCTYTPAHTLFTATHLLIRPLTSFQCYTIITSKSRITKISRKSW